MERDRSQDLEPRQHEDPGGQRGREQEDENRLGTDENRLGTDETRAIMRLFGSCAVYGRGPAIRLLSW